MFVQDFMIVECPAQYLVAEIRSRGRELLGEAVSEAGARLDSFRVKVGPDRWPDLLAKKVDVTLGPVREHGEITLIAFAWHATGAASLFPSLDADLEVSPLGEDRSELTLRGRYVPPGGTPGKLIDRLLLHRLADATIRAFLSNLASRLAAAVPT